MGKSPCSPGKGLGLMSKIFIYGDRGLLRNYADALEFCGARAIFAQNTEYAHDCSGLLLPGGGDIDPALYGQENTGESYNIDRERDEKELELIRAFSVTHRPILGICKGIQILNVAFGGDLIQHLDTSKAHRWDGQTGDQIHEITAHPGSFLSALYGERFFVNSAHHQGVGKIAAGLTLSAEAGDGVVEALEAPEKQIYTVQWHPERMSYHKSRTDTVDGRYLFEFFLNLCG